MEIRSAIPSDFEAVLTILNQAIAAKTNAYTNLFDAVSGQKWFDALSKSSERFAVATISGAVVGWATLIAYRSGREALEGVSEVTFYIHAKFRKMGVASNLITYLEKEARLLDKTHLLAILLDDNQASRALLEKHQFVTWGHLPEIAQFDGTRIGQWYMGKAISGY